jgi:hypothetical protein
VLLRSAFNIALSIKISQDHDTRLEHPGDDVGLSTDHPTYKIRNRTSNPS